VLQLRCITAEKFSPKLWIKIDVAGGRATVIDNGVGMDLSQVKFCFRPNVSFKKQEGIARSQRRGRNLCSFTGSPQYVSSPRRKQELFPDRCATVGNGPKITQTRTPVQFSNILGFDRQNSMMRSLAPCVEILIAEKQRPQPLGVSERALDEGQSPPWVLEYKVDSDILDEPRLGSSGMFLFVGGDDQLRLGDQGFEVVDL
jgi:hypothetical protein